MNSLIFAIKAFWTILLGGTYVYCDRQGHSVNGREINVNECVCRLEDEVEEERLLNEAKRLITRADAY